MKILRKLCSSALLIGLLTGGAGALPEGPTVGSGQGSVNITTNGSTQTIQQFTDRAIINWNSFNIDVGELVNFVQPSSVSAILNRVVGQDPSTILGAMRANGQVFLINPNGVVFGHTANVDVGSLVVSTLGISDQDFLSGNLTFQQEADKDLAAVINHGTIKVDDNGFVVLTGPMVANDGVILARVGQVALAGGTKSTVSFDPTGMIQVELPADAGASDGIVSLSYEDAGDLLASAVSSPQVQAGQIVVRDGRTFLEVESGTVVHAGEIQADGVAGQDAGRVVLDSVANTILSKDSLITAKGVGENSSGGEVYVLSERTADSDFGSLIDVSGGLSGDGGFVEQSANRGRVGVHVRALAANGKIGTFLIDPAFIAIQAGEGIDFEEDGILYIFESNLEQAQSHVLLEADHFISIADLADDALTLPPNINLTIEIASIGGEAASVNFVGENDRIVLQGTGSFSLSGPYLRLRDLYVVTDSGDIKVDFEDGEFSSQFLGETLLSSGSGNIELLLKDDYFSGFRGPASITSNSGDVYLENLGYSNSDLILGGENVTIIGATDLNGIGSDTITADVNARNLTITSERRVDITSLGPNLNVSGGSTYDSYDAFQIRSADSGNGNIAAGNISALGVSIDSGTGSITSTGTIEASQINLNGNNISATLDTQVLWAIGTGDVFINKLNEGGELTYISAGNTASYTTPGHVGGAQIQGKNLILDVGETFEGFLSAEGFVQVTADSIFLDVSAAEVTANARVGDVNLFAYTDNIAVSANSQNGNVDVVNNGNIVQNTISGNAVNVSAFGGDITHGSGRVSGNTVTLTANNVDAHTATSNLTVNLGPTGDFPEEQVPRQTDGALPSGNVTINNDSAALTASIATTGNVDFSNTGALNGNFTANNLKLSGQSVNAGISTGRVEGDATDGNVTLNSNGTSQLAVVGSSAPNGDFVLNHSGDVVFDSINARNVTISTPGNITDTANTIIAQGITLNGNNVLVNTQGQVIVINAQGNVTVTNTVVDVSSLSIDANGNVDFGTDGNLHIAQISGGQLVSLKAGGNISAGPGSYVNGFDVALLAGGTITPDLNAPLQIGATNSILLQAQGGGIAGALQGQLPADAVTIQTPSGLIYYNGILLNGTEIIPPALPDLTEVENQIGQQNGLLIDDGSVGSAANDGLVEESATQKLVSQLTETTGGGEGATTEVLITLEIDALGEVKVELSQPSPFDQTINTSENLSADDVLDLDTEELTEVEVSLYYDAANDQLIMAVNLSADDVLDLDVSEFELIPVNINYQITGDAALMIEHLRANDIIDLHVEELGEIPIKVHVSGN
ncbi:MAG: filamentous hemagglutinin N-terminal domain-containing protein [Vulcanimicrobiota bacterium]